MLCTLNTAGMVCPALTHTHTHTARRPHNTGLGSRGVSHAAHTLPLPHTAQPRPTFHGVARRQVVLSGCCSAAVDSAVCVCVCGVWCLGATTAFGRCARGTPRRLVLTPPFPFPTGAFIAGYMGLGIYNIVAYTKYYDSNLNCEHDFGLWLLISGIFGVGLGLFAFVQALFNAPQQHQPLSSDTMASPRMDSAVPGVPSDPRDVEAADPAAAVQPQTWFHTALPGGLDSFIAAMYTVIAVWTLVGAVWFFGASRTTGDCNTLRKVGLWGVIGVLIFVAVACAVFAVRWALDRCDGKTGIRKLETTPRVVSPRTKSSEPMPSPGAKGDASRPAERTSGGGGGVGVGVGVGAGAGAGAGVGVESPVAVAVADDGDAMAPSPDGGAQYSRDPELVLQSALDDVLGKPSRDGVRAGRLSTYDWQDVDGYPTRVRIGHGGVPGGSPAAVRHGGGRYGRFHSSSLHTSYRREYTSGMRTAVGRRHRDPHEALRLVEAELSRPHGHRRSPTADYLYSTRSKPTVQRPRPSPLADDSVEDGGDSGDGDGDVEVVDLPAGGDEERDAARKHTRRHRAAGGDSDSDGDVGSDAGAQESKADGGGR